MGIKSSYFRHTFNAHKDPKICQLIQRGGVKAVGVYFIILELYGAYISDDDARNQTQEISLKIIANATGLRSDSCQTVIELIADCKLIEALCFKSLITSVKVRVPNFSKYYGKYEKTETMKCPNKRKEKKRKEKEIKEETTAPLALNVITLYDAPKDEDLNRSPEWNVIEYLNLITGKKFKQVDSNYKEIKARLKEGHTVEDMKELIDHVKKVWMTDEFWFKFVRPSTMFNGKFDGYLQDARGGLEKKKMTPEETIVAFNKLFEG